VDVLELELETVKALAPLAYVLIGVPVAFE